MKTTIEQEKANIKMEEANVSTKEYVVVAGKGSTLTGGHFVQELVRCKDCEYYNSEPDSHGDRCDRIHWSRGDDWYCADGKRRAE